MGFGMEASKSVPPDRRQAILHRGLLERRAELRKDWQRFLTPECLKQLGPVSAKVSSLLSGPDAFHDWRSAQVSRWADCQASLSECLLSIGVGETIGHRPSATEAAALSCANLKKLPPQARMQALSVRYRCPLNIGVRSEADIAEELLRQLMVRDRTKLEAEVEFDADDVLLKLNLIGLCAGMKRDLRYLDALNYYYELPHRSLTRLRGNPQWLAAWLCIYAQLLSAEGW
jgi:hypothetical protein